MIWHAAKNAELSNFSRKFRFFEMQICFLGPTLWANWNSCNSGIYKLWKLRIFKKFLEQWVRLHTPLCAFLWNLYSLCFVLDFNVVQKTSFAFFSRFCSHKPMSYILISKQKHNCCLQLHFWKKYQNSRRNIVASSDHFWSAFIWDKALSNF